MSYIIPIGRMSLADQERRRKAAVLAAQQALIDYAVVKTVGAIIDREADYGPDFIPAATRAAAAGFPMSGWMSAALALNNGIYSLFADNTGAAITPVVPNNQIWVFYGAHVLDVNQPVTQLYFAIGTSAIRKAAFDLEKLYSAMETEGYFTQPVTYGPQDVVTVTVKARLATGAGTRVALDTLIVEPKQNTQI